MAFWNRRKPDDPVRAEPVLAAPRASYQPANGGITISTPQQLDEFLRGNGAVTPDTAMRAAAVYAAVRIIAGAVATLPLDLKRRVDARTREDASDDPLWAVLRRKPNAVHTPSGFRRMMQAHVLLRGNAYAMKSVFRGSVTSLVPMHPDRVVVKQLDTGAMQYTYTRKDGRQVVLGQADVMHLYCLTLDGITGVTPLTYARETIGASLDMERHGSNVFRNGARVSTVLSHPGKLGPEGIENLRASIDAYRAGGESEGKALILEEGMDAKPMAMTAEDAQWIEARKFSRTDIAMFMGVPPSMLGDNSGSDSNWGTGLEQKSRGFVTYTLEDHLTMWEETINRDLVPPTDTAMYARFNRAALVRGDLQARWEAHVKALQWGVYSPNEIRALEDDNPREGGDVYYPPPNTAGKPAGAARENEVAAAIRAMAPPVVNIAPAAVTVAAPEVHAAPVHVDVHAHIPRRGPVEKTVTGYDDRGRITGMTEREIDE
jgi:HK97 family phage portal protein